MVLVPCSRGVFIQFLNGSVEMPTSFTAAHMKQKLFNTFITPCDQYIIHIGERRGKSGETTVLRRAD